MTQIMPNRILVVDDDPFVRQVLTNILADEFQVEVAENGQMALDLEPLRFDFIVMDYNMPKLNGVETTIAIRKLEENTTKHVPIIGITANVLEDVKDECLAAGMDNVFNKPILIEDVKALISQYTELSKPACSA